MSGLNHNITDNYIKGIKSKKIADINIGGSTYHDMSLTYENMNFVGSANGVITGIRPEYDGQVILIYNGKSNSDTLRLRHENTNSSSNYRFDFSVYGGVDMSLKPNESVQMIYHNIKQRWVPIVLLKNTT
jgi:hypothetical protein